MFQKIFVFSGIFCVISICVSLASFLARQLWPSEYETQVWAFIIIYLAILTLGLNVLLIVGKGVHQRMLQSVAGIRWFHYAFGPFNGFLLMRIAYLSIQPCGQVVITNPYFYPLFLIQVIWCFSIMYHAVVTVQEKAQASIELKIIQRGLDAEKAYYERLVTMLDEVRAMRHDLKYHISATRSLIKQNKVEEAERYITQIEDTVRICNVPIFTTNQIVNALLIDYHRRCGDNHINFTAGVSLPGTLCSVSDIDLCIIIGNLFENALEAAQKIPENQREVELKAFCKGQNLIISMTNSFDGLVLGNNGQLKSRKVNEGGVGCQSIRAIACKYHGEYLTQWSETEFMSSVILQLNKEDVAQIAIPTRATTEPMDAGIYAQ